MYIHLYAYVCKCFRFWAPGQMRSVLYERHTIGSTYTNCDNCEIISVPFLYAMHPSCMDRIEVHAESGQYIKTACERIIPNPRSQVNQNSQDMTYFNLTKRLHELENDRRCPNLQTKTHQNNFIEPAQCRIM